MKKQMLVIECNDGIHTEAQYFENEKLLATSSAKKHPDDTHNFWTAVPLTIERLPKFNPFTDLKTGMFVKICGCWYMFVENYLISQFGRLVNFEPLFLAQLIEKVVEARNFYECETGNEKILFWEGHMDEKTIK